VLGAVGYRGQLLQPEVVQVDAKGGKQNSTAQSTRRACVGRNSLRAFRFGRTRIPTPEPKVTGSSPVGDAPNPILYLFRRKPLACAVGVCAVQPFLVLSVCSTMLAKELLARCAPTGGTSRIATFERKLWSARQDTLCQH